MGAVPEPAEPAVVRGMAAFMQAAKLTDLPAALRTLKGKHHKMMMARRHAIIRALDDDEGLRALVVDWLADKPAGISKADAALLEVATRRADGWREELASSTAPAPTESGPLPDPTTDLEREKERARKARDEARRAKGEAERVAQTARKEAAELDERVAELNHRVAVLEAKILAATSETARARAEGEREVRKARKRAEKAEADLDAAKAELKELRGELRRTNVADEPAPQTQRWTAIEPSATTGPSRRARLAAPKGRLEDAPETLTEWLSVPSVHLLVDGYNVTKAEGGFGDVSLEGQRIRLIDEVGKVARRHGIKATVVFDGSEIAPGTSRRPRGVLEVEYSRPGETADDHLVAKLGTLPKFPVVVATNDRELQRRVARLGATVATSNQLLALFR